MLADRWPEASCLFPVVSLTPFLFKSWNVNGIQFIPFSIAAFLVAAVILLMAVCRLSVVSLSPVLSLMIMCRFSARNALWSDNTKAGRVLLDCRSVNGKGTLTIS